MRCLLVLCLWALVSTGGASPRARIPRQVNDAEIDPDQLDLLPAASEATDAKLALASVNSAAQEEVCDCEEGLCVCVPYYQCDAVNNTIIEDGRTIIDLRMKGDCGFMQVCCSTGEVIPIPTTGPSLDSGSSILVTDQPDTSSEDNEQTTSTTEQSSTSSDDNEQTTSSTELSNTPSKPPMPTEVCGIRNEIGASSLRIVGAENGEAQFGEFPWMMAIMKQDVVNGQDTLTYQCGGSLITPRVVLTAAHCVQGKTGLMVRAGEYDTQITIEPIPTQDRIVHEIKVHEEYYSGALHNDVALLFLDSAFDTQTENVGTICLPDQDENMDHRLCVATGWGKDLYGQEGQYQVILKKIDLPTVPRDLCQQDLRETRLGSRFNLHTSFLCAGGEVGKDTCKGDGGGPLVCPSSKNPRVYIQAGIVAWGIGCATKTPGVYVDVAKFRNWIDSHLATFNIDERLGSKSESSGVTPFQGEGKPIHFDSPFGGNNETSIIMNS